jgi:hypothetical protein
MASEPNITTPKNQTELRFRFGNTQRLSSTAGTTKASQDRCTETSALVGGSQPQPLQNPVSEGICTCSSCKDPSSNAAHPKQNASKRKANFRLEHNLIEWHFIGRALP